MSFENLEIRTLLAASVVNPGADGILQIDGTSASNTINVSVAGTAVRVVIDGGTPVDFPWEPFSKGEYHHIFIRGLAGNDRINLTPQVQTGPGDTGITIHGGTGNDTIISGNGNDTLLGEEGDDSISGGNGDDTIDGGPGSDDLDGGENHDTVSYATSSTPVKVSYDQLFNDGVNNGGEKDNVHLSIETVIGGSGDDFIDGGGTVSVKMFVGNAGNDTLISGVHHDILDGGAGNDLLISDRARDSVTGGSGNDTIQSGDDQDTVAAGDGADRVDGGAGDDSLSGDGGNDTINGADGNDKLFGNVGNDRLNGGNGGDVLIGHAGRDTLRGGAGSDRVEYTYETRKVIIKLSSKGESGVKKEKDNLGADIENAYGGRGSDLIVGNKLKNLLRGGAGNDTVQGASGNDTLNGDAGNDSLVGGAGVDRLLGGVGLDKLTGNAAADFLDGGADNDTAISDSLDTLMNVP
jgi:Ca2+-binding RTX toxin-like protein